MGSKVVRIGELEIDLGLHRVRRAGRDLRLGRKERALLELLAANANQIITHQQLLLEIWGDCYGDESKYLVHVAIRRLREKLGDNPPRYILAEASLGYRLAAPPDSPPATAAPTTPPGPRHAGLPAPLTSLIGRERQIDTLGRRLRRADVRLLTLCGPGGVGKTRLALQLAEEARTDFADGVIFVPLAGLSDPAQVAPAIIAAAGLKESGDRDHLATLSAGLRDRHLLLVLDNFEHVLEAGPLIAEVLAVAPRLKALATSREPLRLYGEHTHTVPPLGAPDATALFAARAQALRAGFELGPANAAQVAEICDRLDGLPLAIELAAAQITSLSPAAMLDRLARPLDLGAGRLRNLPARHQTLRAVIDWSVHRLEAEERRLFPRLAVFAGPHTVEAAAAVCPDDDQPAIPDRLTALCEKNLLQLHEETDPPRFLMLRTIRDYALELLECSGAHTEARRAHALYHLDLAERAAPGLVGKDQSRWFAALAEVHADLHAALGWMLADDQPELAARMGAALWRYWFYSGQVREGRRWLEPIFDQPQAVPPAQRMALARALSALARAQGDVIGARRFCESGLELARALDYRPAIASLLGSLALTLNRQGYREQAQDCYTEALALHREQGNTREVAAVLGNLSELLRHEGRFEQAYALQQEGLAIGRTIGEPALLANGLNTLGLLAHQLGNLAAARAAFDEGLALAETLGSPRVALAIRVNLGELAEAQGDFASAARHYQAAAELVPQPNDPYHMAFIHLRQGVLARRLGEDLPARTALAAALRLALAHDLPTSQVAALVEIAGLLADQGHTIQAARALGAAARAIDQFGPRIEAAEYERCAETIQRLRALVGDDAISAASAGLSANHVLAELGVAPAEH